MSLIPSELQNACRPTAAALRTWYRRGAAGVIGCAAACDGVQEADRRKHDLAGAELEAAGA